VWIWSNPLGAAPDENDHYIRAVAAGYGQFTGAPAPLQPNDPQGIAGGHDRPIDEVERRHCCSCRGGCATDR